MQVDEQRIHDEVAARGYEVDVEDRSRAVRFAAEVLLILAAITLLLPKLLLLSYTNKQLWTSYHGLDAVMILGQDMLLAVVFYAGLSVLCRVRPRKWHFTSVAILMASLLFLLLDARVRELWLKPIDLSLVRYTLSGLGDLRSGMDVFFLHGAGWNMSFRRTVVVVLGAGASLMVAAGLAFSRVEGTRTPRLLIGFAALTAFGLSLAAPEFRYNLEASPLSGPVVELLRTTEPDDTQVKWRAKFFDQPQRPLTDSNAGPRVLMRGVTPLRNVVVYILESVRWKDLNLEDPTRETPTPTLRRLAEEGLVVRTRVSVPHSSKAHYTIFSGRHPFPGIEMRESMGEHTSLVRALAEERQAHTAVFSSAYLAFENLDGLLAGVGFEERVQADKLDEGDLRRSSSFGLSDENLVTRPAELLTRRPFAAAYIPLAPHYPYDYPDKPVGAGETHDEYLKSLAYADQILSGVIDGLRAQGALEETLVVIVSDHGESFGEHGSLLHNNSLYDEELVVPVVFWTSDGRLAHTEILEGRHIDVAPTAADLLGIGDSSWEVQGVSLLRSPSGPAYSASFFDRVSLSLVDRNRKYLYDPSSGAVLAYDLPTDPGETNPVELSDEERTRIVERLEAFNAYQQLAFSRDDLRLDE